MDRSSSDNNSRSVNEFHGNPLPETGKPVGYAALIDRLGLQVPLPSQLTLISARHVKTTTDRWQILTPRHEPADTLAGQLTFAIKWEGVQLGVLAAMFRAVEPQRIECVSESGNRMWS